MSLYAKLNRAIRNVTLNTVVELAVLSACRVDVRLISLNLRAYSEGILNGIRVVVTNVV